MCPSGGSCISHASAVEMNVKVNGFNSRCNMYYRSPRLYIHLRYSVSMRPEFLKIIQEFICDFGPFFLALALSESMLDIPISLLM